MANRLGGWFSLAQCHPWYRRGNLAVAGGDASEAESAFARAHELEADVPMPFEHALVSLDDGRRLSAAENQPLHNSRAHRIFSELGADP
jgi:hypothetical protein